MSLRTQIRGFTAWVNLRLKPYDKLLNNALLDLFSGTNMKMLIQSMTGHDFKKIQNFDGLTEGQKMTRIDWIIEELKRWKVIPEDVYVDARMFAMRNAEHVFGLLYRLVGHDIVFVWERSEYLRHDDPAILCEVPFKWIPEPPPVKQKKKKAKQRKSLLSGFGASSLIAEKIDEDDTDTVVMDDYNPFPRSEFMKKFKVKLAASTNQSDHASVPTPEECLLDLVNKQLKTLDEGRKLHISCIDDLADTRVLCALTNSIIPNTFTTEVMMNDRWPMNLVLKTVEKILYIDSPFDSEDLTEGDTKSLGAYFCVFFMLAFKYRQMRAVVDMYEYYKRAQLEKQTEFDDITRSKITSADQLQKRRVLQEELENIKHEMEKLEIKFDVPFCYSWMDNIYDVIKQTRKDVLEKMSSRFDVVQVPRELTISTMTLAMSINLTLTPGCGFYLLDEKENVAETRKIILYDKETHKYIDNYNSKTSADYVKGLLKLPIKNFSVASYDLNPTKYPQFDIYVEATSKNKQLKEGSYFLYQVFPTVPTTWHKILFKAVKSDEVETTQRLVAFFRSIPAVLNCREPQTGNSPLHWAAKLGHYNVALSLLEGGANIDQMNNYQQTPLFAACEALQRQVAHLLIEWGCDVHAKGMKNRRAFDMVKNDETRDFLINCYEYYSTVVPKIMGGDLDVLRDMMRKHFSGERPLSNIRSRCINGSTMLHTAAYFGCTEVIDELLQNDIDVNLLDYKGATAIHRACNTDTMKMLMRAGAKTNEEDIEGNTALHVKCYGEVGKPSEVEAIQLLINSGARVNMRNHRNLLPVHCAAMQGRTDVIDLLMRSDQGEAMCGLLADEEHQPARCKNPPSLPHLAVANDHTDAAIWMIKNSFTFKTGEQELLMQKILSEQIQLKERAHAVQFLLENGASVNETYIGNNAALHYAASMSGAVDVMEALITSGADVNILNQDHCTPLMFACQSNNMHAASLLLANGASVKTKNLQGLTAFDFITDYEEWIDSGHFSEEMRARLKAYSLKHARDLIRAISKKVKTRGHPAWLMAEMNPSTSHGTPAPNNSAIGQRGATIKRSAQPGYRSVLPAIK